LLPALLALSEPSELLAQFSQQSQISAGIGASFPSSEHNVLGVGGSVVYERRLASPHWAGVRLYAGGFFSRTDRNRCPASVQPCSVSSQIAVGGAKLRLLAPIPYVAPYFEIGAGLSAGSIRTQVAAFGRFSAIDVDQSGVLFHLPVGLGIAFGRHHQHKLSVDYFVHPYRDHIAGTLSVGVGM
jgi:hypothetical protein